MKAKQDSNLQYGTVLHSTKDVMLPSIWNANNQYRSNKNLDFVIFQGDYLLQHNGECREFELKGVQYTAIFSH